MLLILLMTMAGGCGTERAEPPVSQPQPDALREQEEGTRTIVNIDGTTITVPAKVERVAALFGPSYEKVFVLGAEDKIVANGDFHIDGWPWSNVIYKRLDEVPGVPHAHTQLNIEEIVKLDPDVVFYWANPDEIAKLESVGIAAVPSASTGSFEDVKNMLMVYAQVLGPEEEAIAREYAGYFDEKVKMITDVTSQIPAEERPRVYFANQEILWTAGKSSDIPEVIELAGGNCVHKDLEGGGKMEIGLEQFVQWNPEYVFVDHAGSSGNAPAEEVVKELVADDRFQEVAAVKNDKVFICPTGVFFWDAGVQKILMLQWMAQELYPDKFPDLDMKTELKYFYDKFYSYSLTDDEAERIIQHLNP